MKNKLRAIIIAFSLVFLLVIMIAGYIGWLVFYHIPSLSESIEGRLVLLTYSDNGTRHNAISGISRFDDPRAKGILLVGLYDDTDLVRGYSLDEIIASADPSFLPFLLDRFADKKLEPGLRISKVLEAIIVCGDNELYNKETVVERMVHAFDKIIKDDHLFKQSYIEILRRHSSSEIARMLITRLEMNKNKLDNN